MTKKDDIMCSAKAVNLEKVNRTLELLPDFDKTQSMSYLFKAFADPTRLQIMQALAVDEHCVCDLSALLNLSMSAVSHQLRQLRDIGLIVNRKDGKMVHYSLSDSHVTQLLALGYEHITELK